MFCSIADDLKQLLQALFLLTLLTLAHTGYYLCLAQIILVDKIIIIIIMIILVDKIIIINIIMIIMIILVDKILFPCSMIFMMVAFRKLYTIHALVLTPKKSSIVNAFRAHSSYLSHPPQPTVVYFF